MRNSTPRFTSSVVRFFRQTFHHLYSGLHPSATYYQQVPSNPDVIPMAGLQADSALVAGLSEAKRDEFEDEKARGSQEIASSTEDHKLEGDLKRDGIHDGLEFPTDEERETLRRVADK